MPSGSEPGPSADRRPVGLAACACLTAHGDTAATVEALRAGRVALTPHPVLGAEGGDRVPLALLGPMDEAPEPRWLEPARRLAASIPAGNWGGAREPVIVTSSNFGVGSLHAFISSRDPRHLAHGPPFAAVDRLAGELGWGGNRHVFSHACVTAHLGLLQAARMLRAGCADRVLVFSFDCVSPFVAGGFHSLKILNAGMPAPYQIREFGAIGLGDGLAFAVLTPDAAGPRLEAHVLHNEMFHFTANQPDGGGFARISEGLAAALDGRRVWIKGHGTGTLEAGRLEAEAFARAFPDAPLVSWKGSLGHTLGSCGLVELALALAAMRTGARTIPGTVGTSGPCFTGNVALAPFDAAGYDAAVLASNAFGGAHAAMLLTHV